jgi:MYXO-CTERM domain-containing protein
MGAADWTHAGTPSSSDQWEAGAPMGIGGDPKTAHGGTNVFGIDLGNDDGLYEARGDTYAESPEIDLKGNTNVHLQYYRWLNVEDGVYDQATISANDAPVWTNYASQGMPTTDEINHTDKEWRFQDVDLSAQAASGKIKLKFGLKSDPGLQLGGWTIDDVCIVAVGKTATCGNGTLDQGETCDDGNTTDGDGCSATCQDESGGTMKDSGGCCSIGGSPAGPLALGLFTLGLVIRRRRRR